MFKQKTIGQLIDGNNYKISLDSDFVTFSCNKDAQKTIKEYKYLLNEKQLTLNNNIKYLDTACEFAKVDKIHVIEIVRNKDNYKKYESINNILD